MKAKFYFLLLALCCFAVNAFSQSEVIDPLITPFPDNEIQTVPTFNGCSYYFRLSSESPFRVEYKRTDETNWRAAHPTVCDQPAKIHKGSLFNLAEDTEYQIRILGPPVSISELIAQTTFRTWSGAPRIAKTIEQNSIIIHAGLFSESCRSVYSPTQLIAFLSMTNKMQRCIMPFIIVNALTCSNSSTLAVTANKSDKHLMPHVQI